MVGNSGVGKTSIISRYVTNKFSDVLMSTTGASYATKKIEIDSEHKIKLQIWDNAGQERFRSVALQALKAVQGIILVFDLTKRESFININNWLETVKENLHNPNLILFGNKADIKKEDWKVTSEEAKNFAVKLNMKYVETSAYTRQGLDEGFSSLINDTYNKVKGKNDDSGKIEIKKDNNEDEYVTGCFGKKKK